jgi:Domain of unknown function (DUF1707)
MTWREMGMAAPMAAGHGSPVAGGERGTMRAADADRDRVAGILSTAYSEGRLSRDEDVADQPLGPGFTPAVALPAGLVATVPVLITLGMDEGLAATPGYDDATGAGTPDPGYFASYRGAPG